MKLNKKIKLYGLFIDNETPFLGADGIIEENGFVEIKLQDQLKITKREYCIFAVWAPKSIKILHIIIDNEFWKNQMLPFLTRFYYECMFPEILDSRHNKQMPIRDPKYIIEAKKKTTKLARKRYKSSVLPVEAAFATAAAINIEQDDDCIIINYSNKHETTNDDIEGHEKILNAPLSVVKDNILPIDSKINDESLNRFLRVVRETSDFETQTTNNNKSLQIIGGNCSNHWRCIFFGGTKFQVYDSLTCTYSKLIAKEKNYIHLRNIFEKIQTPNGLYCGIYVAAFASIIAFLRGNPYEQKYSENVKCMREHFFLIIEGNELLPFPK
ncbi:hypothetical protein ACFW04_011400 [Cataglyphis niger]